MIRIAALPLPHPSDAAVAPGGGATDFSVDSRQAPGLIIVAVAGRVTIDTSPRLRSAVHAAIAAGQPAVTIDFSAAPYLDTSAIATLLEAATQASSRQVRLRITGLGGDARMVAERAELDRIFPALGGEVEFA
jgi:anti-anti-sigma factor